jgi:hypothetical protein
LQICPGQQGWPRPPQVTQVPLLQEVLESLHELAAQQICEGAPQAMHLPADPQAVPEAVHFRVPAQQASFSPPQAPEPSRQKDCSER